MARRWFGRRDGNAEEGSCCGGSREAPLSRGASPVPSKVLNIMDGSRLRPADLRRARRVRVHGADGPSAPADPCACETVQPNAKVAQPKRGRGGPRTVDGTWLAQVLARQIPDVGQIEGRQVEVTEEAWWALRATLDAPVSVEGMATRVARRRAQLWPEGRNSESRARGAREARFDLGPRIVTNVFGEKTLDAGACDCTSMLLRPARYVNEATGSDLDSGAFQAHEREDGTIELALRPWMTLRRVEQWLNEGIYSGADVETTALKGAWVFLARNGTWDGSEEQEADDERVTAEAAGESIPDAVASLTYITDWSSPSEGERGDYAILTLQEVKGAGVVDDHEAPVRVILSAYGSGGAAPIIDGSTGSYPTFDDKRTGILVVDCCYLAVRNLTVRGFKTAIDVRGEGYDQVYSKLELKENAVSGISIGVDQRDIDYYVESEGGTNAEAAEAMALSGMYPDQIVVDGCTLSSNGYTTSGADIALGFLATNCTISNNEMRGDDDRGIDGIVAQVASSGHLIEDNTIYGHNRYCYSSRTDKSVIVETDTVDSTTCTGTYVLLQACDDADSGCVPGTFGYDVEYYDPEDPPSAITDGEEAFGEDGIDLKAVQNRTATSADETVVRGNTIYGHTNGSRAGINISDGSQEIHIYNNRILLNAIGILITNNTNQSDYWTSSATSGVYVYRNLVYMNQERGIVIKSQDDDDGTYTVENVYLINNTIAHNLLTGVLVANGTGSSYAEDPPDVNGIYLYNNLIARNGIGGEYEGTYDADSMQVAWSGTIDLAGGVFDFDSNYNCYLGWSRELDGTEDQVIRSYVAGAATDEYGRTLSGAQDQWSIEDGGVQASSLEELYLGDESTMLGFETTSGSTSEGDNLFDYVLDFDYSDVSMAIDLDYGPTDAASLCVDVAWADAGTSFGVYYFDTSEAIPTSIDLANNPNTGDAPDIGAMELV